MKPFGDGKGDAAKDDVFQDIVDGKVPSMTPQISKSAGDEGDD